MAPKQESGLSKDSTSAGMGLREDLVRSCLDRTLSAFAGMKTTKSLRQTITISDRVMEILCRVELFMTSLAWSCGIRLPQAVLQRSTGFCSQKPVTTGITMKILTLS